MSVSASTTDGIAADVLAILSDAERLEAVSRTDPHRFHEQKDGLVQRLKELHAKARDGEARVASRHPSKTTTFRPGTIVSRKGRAVVAEVRKARLSFAR